MKRVWDRRHRIRYTYKIGYAAAQRNAEIIPATRGSSSTSTARRGELVSENVKWHLPRSYLFTPRALAPIYVHAYTRIYICARPLLARDRWWQKNATRTKSTPRAADKNESGDLSCVCVRAGDLVWFAAEAATCPQGERKREREKKMRGDCAPGTFFGYIKFRRRCDVERN